MTDETTTDFPESVQTEPELEDLLTRPGAALVDSIATVTSPLIILGAGGKMGPTLAAMARRAAIAAGHDLKVLAASRFSDDRAKQWLERQGVTTIPCDLLESSSLSKLPDATNVIYLVGQKFGTTKSPATTWAMNTIPPARVVERYPKARIVALSTGNVYPLSEAGRGGSLETDPLTPLGEYPNAAVGRERVFEFFSSRNGTPLALIRLFYAVELRYGVLVDIAQSVYADQAIHVENGYFNCIWQGDANEMILRALALAESPPTVWNLCRPEVFSIRKIATRLGQLFGCEPRFSGEEAKTALLGNSARICAALGPPSTSLDAMLRRIAHWVKLGGRNLGKPTHFEVRDGNY